MQALFEFFLDIGNSSLSAFWLPMIVWSAVSSGIWLISKFLRKEDSLFQYYVRLSLVAGLPIGLVLSITFNHLLIGIPYLSNSVVLPALSISSNLVPVPISEPATAVIPWNIPMLWTELCTLVVGAVSFLKLFRTVQSYRGMHELVKNIKTYSLSELDLNLTDNSRNSTNIIVGFSTTTNTPITFGWRRPIIIIPGLLQQEADNLYAIIKHELVHIQRADFLLNSIIQLVNSLFWFHPLVHLYSREAEIYREISYDGEVLSDSSISHKKYVQLLYRMSTSNLPTLLLLYLSHQTHQF